MQLFYQTYGTGNQALLILHGLLGSSDNWHTLAKRFGERFRVFALDARNHGRSPHSDVFNYNVMAEDVVEFMEQQHLTSASLLGHSMGGKTAMILAAAHPELVDSLVVVDIAPKPSTPSYEDIFKALASLDLKGFSFRKDIDGELAKKIPNVVTRQFLMKNLKRDESGAFQWKMNLKTIYGNYEGMDRGLSPEKTFDKPTLFIRGGNSRYILDQDRELIHQIFPRSSIVTIPNAGHWVHADAPEELYGAVMGFWRDNAAMSNQQ
ncbi:MAG: alpha/beta fold hydrolase [Bacteroidota bacterium]